MGLPFVSDLGSNYLTRCLLRDPAAPGGDWYLRLFSNNFAPQVNSVPANFTESTFPTYAPRLLDPAIWLPPFFGPFGSTAYYGNQPQLYTTTGGPYSIWGWYVTFENTMFMWGQGFSGAVSISSTAPFVFQPVWAGLSLNRP